MKIITTMAVLVMSAASCFAQTSTELIGKWKLIKLTKDGKEQSIQQTYKTEEVYQVFLENGVFQGIVGEKKRKGKWQLSSDNKLLTVKVSIVSVKFDVDYFDATKRIISSPQTGTLEYTKVE